MQPETVQEMITKFLKPSFIGLWALVTMIVTVVHLLRLYKYSSTETDGYIQESLNDDLADISTYYQQGRKNNNNHNGEQDQEEVEDVAAKSTRRKTTAAIKKNTTAEIQKKVDHSEFWVACLASHPQVILGCVALEDLNAHQEHLKKKHEKSNQLGNQQKSEFKIPDEKDCELRRMSVHPDYRRLGIGKMLLIQLKTYAKEQGFKRVVLTTTTYQHEAIAGYEKFGFVKEKIMLVDKYFRIWFGVLEL